MAASNEWTEWHLTPQGWVTGSEKTDFGDIVRRDRPADCVMSTKYSEYAGSVHSALQSKIHIEWQHSDAGLVKALLDQFGPSPEHL